MNEYRSPTPLAILLATYNSSKYLSQQIDSLYNQTYQDWTLYIHDDGSKDDTLSIIDSYINKHNNIILIDDGIKYLGAKLNFIHILSNVHADYYMFCDHDDVWLPNKIAITRDELKKLECLHPNKAVVVHTDLTVVDAELNIIDTSMWHYSKIKPELLKKKNYTFVSYYITGCSLGINDKAKYDLALDMPLDAVMHDWWIGIQAVLRGAFISSIPESTVLYRLHGNNESGIPKRNVHAYLRRLVDYKSLFAGYRKMKLIFKGNNHCFGLKYFFYKALYTIQRNY
jgi:glycosyltransferase involved in cell wall biosynthesis